MEERQGVILLGHGSIREEANVEVRGMWRMLAEQLPELTNQRFLCGGCTAYVGGGSNPIGGRRYEADCNCSHVFDQRKPSF